MTLFNGEGDSLPPTEVVHCASFHFQNVLLRNKYCTGPTILPTCAVRGCWSKLMTPYRG